MFATTLRLPILSLAVLTMVARGESTTYYVDAATGRDSNPGTASSPWKTIQKAANSVEGTSVVTVRAGTYKERVTVRTSGTRDAPITFQAQGSVVVEGFTIYADYVRVTGFDISNSNISYPDGTGVSVQGRFNEIRNNYIHDLLFGEGVWLYGGPNKTAAFTSNNIVAGNRIIRARIAGILVEGTDNLIEDNDISHTVQEPAGAPVRIGEDADGIRFFGSGHILRRNRIHDITTRDPGNPDPHIDAFQTWGPCTNIVIEQNKITQAGAHDQGVTIEGMIQPVENITIRNNVFVTYGTDYAPAVLAGDGGLVKDVRVINNTIAGLNGPTEYAFWLFAGLDGAIIKNNAIYDHGNDHQPYIRVEAGASRIDIGFNAVSRSDGRAPAGFAFPGDLWMMDPQFVNRALEDFHLGPTSPLINAGALLSAVAADFDGLPRPVGPADDIGAFEFH